MSPVFLERSRHKPHRATVEVDFGPAQTYSHESSAFLHLSVKREQDKDSKGK